MPNFVDSITNLVVESFPAETSTVANGAIAVAAAAVTAVAARQLRQAIKLNQQFLAQSQQAGRVVFNPQQLASLLDPTQSLKEVMFKIKKLGSGAFGEVSLWQDFQGHKFAVKKFVSSPWGDTSSSSRRFESLLADAIREFDIGLNCNHSSINATYHLFVKIGRKGNAKFYVIKEYLPGQELTKAGRLNEEGMWRALRGLLSSVRHMADEGIVPRDLHHGNVMLTPRGSFQWVDLGCFVELHEAWNRHQTYMLYLARELRNMGTQIVNIADLPDETSGWIRGVLNSAFRPLKAADFGESVSPGSLQILILCLDSVLEKFPNPDTK